MQDSNCFILHSLCISTFITLPPVVCADGAFELFTCLPASELLQRRFIPWPRSRSQFVTSVGGELVCWMRLFTTTNMLLFVIQYLYVCVCVCVFIDQSLPSLGAALVTD